jgi:hypothetical protein
MYLEKINQFPSIPPKACDLLSLDPKALGSQSTLYGIGNAGDPS